MSKAAAKATKIVIQKWMEENVNDISEHDEHRFWQMYHDRTSASWGWNTPVLVDGFRVAWLHISPATKDCRSCAVYDYIPEQDYQENKDRTYDEMCV